MMKNKSGIKNLICIVISAAFIFSGAFASAQNELVFDLDVVEIADKTSSSLIGTDGTIAKKEMESLNGMTPYLQNENGHIVVESNTINSSNSMTVSCWLNIKSTDNDFRRVMGIFSDKQNMEVMYNDNQLYFRPGCVNSSGELLEKTVSIKDYTDKWAFYTFTREFTGSKWVYGLYINAKKIYEITANGIKPSETDGKFYIGAAKEGIVGLTMGIGSFGIYNAVLTQGDIQELFENSYESFEKPIDNFEFVQVTPSDGKVDINQGFVTVLFSNLIDRSSIDGNVSLKKEGTDENVDGFNAEVADDNKMALKISFDTLSNNTKYILTIKSGLKSKNNISFDCKELIFTAIDEKAPAKVFSFDAETQSDTTGNSLEIKKDGDMNVGYFESIEGQTAYLQNIYGSISVNNEKIHTNASQTFCGWLNISSEEDDYFKRVMALYSDKQNMEIMYHDKQLYVRPGIKSTGELIETSIKITDYVDKWSFYSFERSFENGVWTYSLYINSDLIFNLTAEGTMPNEKESLFYIGTQKNGISGLKMGIGSFDIYNYILSESEIKDVFSKEFKSYMQIKNVFNVESYIPSDGKIDVNANSIVINFDNYIDESTIDGNAVFKKADEPENVGSYTVECDSSLKKLTFNFGKLDEASEYKVILKSGLQSINGIPLAETEMTYKTVDSSIIIDTDFSSNEFVVGENAPYIDNLTYLSDGIVSNSNIYVCESQSGKKYLSVGGNLTERDNMLKLDFNPHFTDGQLNIIAYVRASSILTSREYGTSPRDLGRINGSKIGIANLGANITDKGDSEAESTFKATETTKDSDGFWHIKIVIKRDKDTGYYGAEMYDLNKSSQEPYVVKKTSATISEIENFLIIHNYPTSAEQASYDRAEISYLKVYTSKSPKVISSNMENISPDDDIELVFNDNIDTETLKYIALKDKDGNEVLIDETDYNDINRTVTVKLSEYLKYQNGYTLSYKGLKNTSGVESTIDCSLSFNTKDYDVTVGGFQFKNNQNIATALLSDLKSCTYTIKNTTTEDKNISVLCIAYDADKKIIAISKDEYSLNAGEEKPTGKDFDDSMLINSNELKIMIWHNSPSGYLSVYTDEIK